MARFSTLPDDCVQLIFDRIPTGRLFKVGRVCRAWRRHQLLNCRRRKTLILMQGRWNAQSVIEKSTFNKPFVDHHIDQQGNYKNYKSYFDHYGICIPSCSYKSLKVNIVVNTFPNVEKLIISADNTYSAYLRSYIQLITSYLSKLVSLQLYFGDFLRSTTQINSVSKIFGNLINQLNSLTVLQHFTFSSRWSLSPPIEAPQFITRLKEFYFNCGHGLEKVMFEWVQKYDKAEKLNQLSRIYLTNYSSLQLRGQRNPSCHIPVANCFAFLPVSIAYNLEVIDEEYMKTIVANFPSITTFKYTLGEINSLAKLATILSPLTKLVHIGLTIEVATPIEPLNSIFTAQQKSIKALDLEFPGCYNDCSDYANFLQSQIRTIVHIFPNLQSIRITPDREYEYDDDGEDYDDRLKLRELAGQFFVNLKAAYGRSSLRTMYYD